MKVNILTFADSVNSYEGGKLVIVGTFDNVEADKCPFVLMKPIGVAIKLKAERNDYGKNYDGFLVLRKAGTKKAVIKLSFPVKFPQPPVQKGVSFVAGINLGGLKFDSFGTYILELKVGSKVISAIRLNMVKAKLQKRNKVAREKSKKEKKKKTK